MDLPQAVTRPGRGVGRRMCANGAREAPAWGFGMHYKQWNKTGDGVSARRQGCRAFLCLDASLTLLFYLRVVSNSL